jgi:hypothetical protein
VNIQVRKSQVNQRRSRADNMIMTKLGGHRHQASPSRAHRRLSQQHRLIIHGISACIRATISIPKHSARGARRIPAALRSIVLNATRHKAILLSPYPLLMSDRVHSRHPPLLSSLNMHPDELLDLVDISVRERMRFAKGFSSLADIVWGEFSVDCDMRRSAYLPVCIQERSGRHHRC